MNSAEITFKGPDGFRSEVKEVKLYSDGTPMIKMDNFAEILDRADTMVLRPKSLSSFVEGMLLVDAVLGQGGWIHQLILPYVPGARQDRTNVNGDVLFTAKSVAKMINQRAFSRVLILDPHSPVITDLIDNVRLYPLEKVADRMWCGYDGIIAADEGGKARAEKFATAMNLPIFYGSKHRDVATGRLSGFEVEKLKKGDYYLVVDDICDGGGTFVGLGDKINAQGAFADLFVSHGIFSKGATDLRDVYGHIYTTDSRIIHNHLVTTIPILEDMENYL